MEPINIKWAIILWLMFVPFVCVCDQTESMKTLTRHVMQQQFYNRQQSRSSGFKVYHTNGGSFSVIHDLAKKERTVGMGELMGVVNGVEFRKRHNDYQLKRPHQTSKEYGAVEDIAFPDVPQSVSQLPSVPDQVNEMKEYFRAFKLQDPSIRNFESYFKPNICYLEGAWYFVDAEMKRDEGSWKELQDILRFTEYSGSRSPDENHSFLPQAVIDIINDIPVIGQWNYRILCHPLANDLKINQFSLANDLASGMRTGKSLQELMESTEARFTLFGPGGKGADDYVKTLMEQIPGADNYAGLIQDEAFGLPARELNSDGILNAGYYHNSYRRNGKVVSRGNADETLFMAMTTQENIVGMNFNNCRNEWKKRAGCENYHQKWTYAIPLEIIYMTPLAKWNPFEISFRSASDITGTDEVTVEEITAGGGDGSFENPYNRIDSDHFYHTPDGFYVEDSEANAFEAEHLAYVLDSRGTKQKVWASGSWIMSPTIKDVGKIRLRYPIMPVVIDGSFVEKELQALKDKVDSLSPPMVEGFD